MKYFDQYATLEESKRTYIKWMIKFHPDKWAGDHSKVDKLNAEWNGIEKLYKSGELPKKVHLNNEFPVLNLKVKQAPRGQRYSLIFQEVKYTGTKEEIILKVMNDFGSKAALEVLTIDFTQELVNRAVNDIFKNLFK